MSRVVLLKTHVWNDKIEVFAKKIMKESLGKNMDFFVLMHNDSNIFGLVKDSLLKNNILKFTENEIKNIYPTGFYDMWLSNHWILMWFFKNNKKYDYYWCFEYDVRIVGDSSIIWCYSNNDDFLYTRGNYHLETNKYFNHYCGKLIKNENKLQGSLQIARYSKKFLEYLDKCFETGENGQDELIIYSLLNHGNFTKSSEFLSSLVKGTWTWDTACATKNRMLYERLEKMISDMPKNTVYVMHPVK